MHHICKFTNPNHLVLNKDNILSFKSWEKDVNLDGKYDSLHFNIEVPLADSEAIHSVQLLLIFDYQLHVSEILNLDSTGHLRGG